MTRPLLKGIAIGAALAAIPASAFYIFADRAAVLSVRIADDSPLSGTDQDKAADGPASAAVIRECGISKFTFDSVRNDHTSSSFFKVADTTPEQLNCVIGRSRARHLGLAVSTGFDTTEFYNLPGDPVAYTRCEPSALVAGNCKPKKK